MADIVNFTSLIDEEYFKAYSPIPENYNISELRPYFRVAESMWVIPIIGKPLYDELIEQIETETLTPDNSLLLLNIYPLLSFAIVNEGMPMIAYHFSQVGITKGKSDNSDSISTKDINYIANTVRSQCEVMKTLLKNFLNENAEKYPKYTPDPTSECECSCNDDLTWLFEYYQSGTYDIYAMRRHINEMRMRKFNPQGYRQLYGTKRECINMQ